MGSQQTYVTAPTRDTYVHIENIEFAISINININGIIGKFGTVPMSSASQDHESAGQAQKDLAQAFQDLAKSVITLRVLPIHPCPRVC